VGATLRLGPLAVTVGLVTPWLRFPQVRVHFPDVLLDPPQYAPMTPEEQYHADRDDWVR
jgi:hypothetical protein